MFIYSVAFTLNNKGYVGTGSFDGKGFFEYDPAVDKWSKKTDFAGSARRSSIGFSVNGKGYIGGGFGRVQITPTSTEEVGLNDIWEYNMQADNWVRVVDFPSVKPRYSVAGVINGKALVGTGEDYPNPFSHKEFFIY